MNRRDAVAQARPGARTVIMYEPCGSTAGPIRSLCRTVNGAGHCVAALVAVASAAACGAATAKAASAPPSIIEVLFLISSLPP